MAPKNTSIYAYMAEENNSYLFISATVNCFQIQYKCSYEVWKLVNIKLLFLIFKLHCFGHYKLQCIEKDLRMKIQPAPM